MSGQTLRFVSPFSVDWRTSLKVWQWYNWKQCKKGFMFKNRHWLMATHKKGEKIRIGGPNQYLDLFTKTHSKYQYISISIKTRERLYLKGMLTNFEYITFSSCLNKINIFYERSNSDSK